MSVPKDFDELAAMELEDVGNMGRSLMAWVLFLIIQAIAELREGPR